MMGEIMKDTNERMAESLRRYEGGGMGMLAQPGFGYDESRTADYSYGLMASLLGHKTCEKYADLYRSLEQGPPTGGVRPREPPLGWNGGRDNSRMLHQIGVIASEHDRRINQMRDFMGTSDGAVWEQAYRRRQQELWASFPHMERDFMSPGPGMGERGRNYPMAEHDRRRRWQPNPMNGVVEDELECNYGR